MTKRHSRSSMDWEAIGKGIYQLRVLRGESQERLAQLAGLGVSTIYHAERGNPIRQGSLHKICLALGAPVEEFLRPKQMLLSGETPVIVHPYDSSVWIVAVDLRKSIPDDDFTRIQNSEERLRLGRLGLVALFGTTPSFIMPNGPGLSFFELFHRFERAINDGIYRECTIRCEQGKLRLCIANNVIELGPGDLVAYYSADLQWTEPATPTDPTGMPVKMTWSGAVRLGQYPPRP